MGTLSVDIEVSLRHFDVVASFEAHPGAPVAIVGPSGAGKSTIIRAVAGLVRPRAGYVRVGSTALFDAAGRIDVPPHRRAAGVVFQQYCLFPHLTVRRNIAFGCHDADRVAAMIEEFGLDRLAEVRPAALSGGERQRVALARALAAAPAMLLLDEPTAALDVHARADVIGGLARVLRASAAPAVVVTHSFDEAAMVADDIVVIDQGRVVQRGSATELLAAPEHPFVAQLTGANVMRGVAVLEPDSGLTRVQLDAGLGGAVVRCVTPLTGSVAVLVSPSEITIGASTHDASALNHIIAEITSIVPLGNRVRVQVGPLVAEITSESCARMGLRIGDSVEASFKATSARLLAIS